MAPKVQYQTHKLLVEGVVTKLGVAALGKYVNLMSTTPYTNEAGFQNILEQCRNSQKGTSHLPLTIH